jgi:hypothetical protein
VYFADPKSPWCQLGRSWVQLLGTGFLGGLGIGVGVLAFLLVEGQTRNVLLAGLAFSSGFIALPLAPSEPFTENFLVPVVAVVAKAGTLRSLAQLWASSLMTNLAGGWLLAALGGHHVPWPRRHRQGIHRPRRHLACVRVSHGGRHADHRDDTLAAVHRVRCGAPDSGGDSRLPAHGRPRQPRDRRRGIAVRGTACWRPGCSRSSIGCRSG